MLPTYMRRMRNNNVEIRIADSSCRPQIRKIEDTEYVHSATIFS